MMSILMDEGQRRFFYGLAAILTVMSVLALALWCVNGDQMKKAALRHDRYVVSSLADQGVSEEVIAKAFAEKEITEKGVNLLGRIGLNEETELFFMPEYSELQRRTGILLAALFFLLWVSLLALAGVFFSAREKICRQAIRITEQFGNGDFTEHLPRMEEGCFYRLLGKIDGLANGLAAGKEESVKAKNFLKDTISDISHQLKTPLAALAMYHEIIKTDAEDKESVLKFTQKASAALERVEELIQALLKVTRLDAGAVVFEKQRWLLADVAARAVSELLVRAKEEGKEILVEGDEEVWLNCDLQWTGEAMGNLVKNALDYTECGGQVRISWEALPGMVRVLVEDNGKGIEEKDIYHIFKRFYRTSKGKETGQGVGLGLPLAKSIVEGQGGTLTVRSRAGEGTEFTMMLPEE